MYIIDHGSDDHSVVNTGSVNVVQIPRSPLDEEARCRFVSEFCSSLLYWYEAVLYTDVDEILVPDPRLQADLAAFARYVPYDVTTALGMHIAHFTPLESKLCGNGNIMQQRHFALPVGSMSKPLLIKRPVRWAPGFHHADAPAEFSSLFLFHLAYCDMDIVRKRQAKRNAAPRVEGHSPHHGMGEDFIQHVGSWPFILPVMTGADLGEDCPVRMEFITRLLSEGESPGNVHSPVTGSHLWRLPDRFSDRF